MPRGAPKKFWSQSCTHKVQEFCLQSWCLLCMQTARLQEKGSIKYSSLGKDIGYIVVFVPMFVFNVFVEGICYIDA